MTDIEFELRYMLNPDTFYYVDSLGTLKYVQFKPDDTKDTVGYQHPPTYRNREFDPELKTWVYRDEPMHTQDTTEKKSTREQIAEMFDLFERLKELDVVNLEEVFVPKAVVDLYRVEPYAGNLPTTRVFYKKDI